MAPKKGTIPWNKNLKGILKPNKGTFKKGQEAWNKGVKQTPEQIEINRQSHVGIKHSAESLSKIKAFANSPEFRKKNRQKSLGKKHTLETIHKMVIHRNTPEYILNASIKQKSKGITGRNHPMFGKTTRKNHKGFYYNSPFQETVYLRSSYELAYAKYLDSQKILWFYEIETFDLGSTTYTPDFFLPRTEEFIETKGYFPQKIQDKINQFKSEYPWIDLKILFKNDLELLGCNIK